MVPPVHTAIAYYGDIFGPRDVRRIITAATSRHLATQSSVHSSEEIGRLLNDAGAAFLFLERSEASPFDLADWAEETSRKAAAAAAMFDLNSLRSTHISAHCEQIYPTRSATKL
jgi:hypothetical protein